MAQVGVMGLLVRQCRPSDGARAGYLAACGGIVPARVGRVAWSMRLRATRLLRDAAMALIAATVMWLARRRLAASKMNLPRQPINAASGG